MDYQLMQEIYERRLTHMLSREQNEFIQNISRPQLKEDIYLSMTGQSRITLPHSKRDLPLREIIHQF